MKTSSLLAALLLSGLCLSPLYAQEAAAQPAAAPATSSHADKAASLAADKGSHIALVSDALFKAVQADPDNAHTILANVLAQRSEWTAAEVHVLFRTAWMAHPELAQMGSNVRVVEAGSPEANAAEQAAAAHGANSGAAAEAPVHPMLKNLVEVLYQSPSVSSDALQSVVGGLAALSPDHLRQVNKNINAGDTSSGGGQHTNAAPSGDIVPGPAQVSPLY